MKKHFLLLGLLVALPASAEGIYVFGDGGQSTFSVDFFDVVLSKTETTYGIGIGYEVNQTFSFELAYRDLGASDSADMYEKSKVEKSAVQASLLANYAVSPVVEVFGRLGVANLKSEGISDIRDYSENNTPTSLSNTKAFYGAGASYAANEKLSFRGEYNRYSEWEGVTVSILTIGAVYKF